MNLIECWRSRIAAAHLAQLRLAVLTTLLVMAAGCASNSVERFVAAVADADAKTPWIRGDGMAVAAPDTSSADAYAIDVHQKSGVHRIESYSILDGAARGEEFVDVAVFPGAGVDVEVAREKSVSVSDAQLRALERFPVSLSIVSEKVFGPTNPTVIRVNLVGDKTKHRVRWKDDMSDGVATIAFYVRASDFDEKRQLRSYLSTIAHEFHHMASDIALGWDEGDASAPQSSVLKAQVLDELAARIFSSCSDLELFGKATAFSTLWVRFGGRNGTASDQAISDFLSRQFDEVKLKKSRALELLKGYQLAFYWTLWVETSGNVYEIRKGEPEADRFQALCDRGVIGSRAGLTRKLASIASDGIDSPEFDAAKALEDLRRRYRAEESAS